jgi:hypothetical protein
MIEHADAALEAWLSTLDPPVEVAFERPTEDGGRGAKRPVLSLVLTSVREQVAKRDNQVTDLRSSEGRVVGRQAATRFFELDYVCSVSGPARDAHRALGDVLQLLVDHDIVPVEHVPDELSALGYPIDVQLVSPPGSVAAVSMRVVLPVQPTPDRQIGPPATSLHLEMAPPPEPKARGGALVPVAAAPAADVVGPVPERKWTTVRRRELITREQHAAANDDDKPAQKSGRKGG